MTGQIEHNVTLGQLPAYLFIIDNDEIRISDPSQPVSIAAESRARQTVCIPSRVPVKVTANEQRAVNRCRLRRYGAVDGKKSEDPPAQQPVQNILNPTVTKPLSDDNTDPNGQFLHNPGIGLIEYTDEESPGNGADVGLQRRPLPW